MGPYMIYLPQSPAMTLTPSQIDPGLKIADFLKRA